MLELLETGCSILLLDRDRLLSEIHIWMFDHTLRRVEFEVAAVSLGFF